MNIDETYGADFIDEQYRRWREQPESVSENWRYFFKGFEIASATTLPSTTTAPAKAVKQAHVEALIQRYRDLGHLMSCLDPLSVCPTSHPLLDLSTCDLSEDDLDDRFHAHLGDLEEATLGEILRALKETYCRSIGVEYMHLQDPDEREWLRERMEPNRNRPQLSRDDRIRILQRLVHASQFEVLLNRKYPGQTRFSLEGAESLIPTLDALLLKAGSEGVTDVIFGMAHRGRLNMLVNILQKPYLEVFQEFTNSYDPDSLVGDGDVKYHNGYFSQIELEGGQVIRLLLVNNPSHLESVDPVVEGVARGVQDELSPGDRWKVMPILIHGDAAFAGQGVVMETLNLSQLTGYRTGGTVHIVINNQIGYTTLPEHARSTRYSTDVAKMLMSPIFHVHGENPEALVHVIRLADEYRRTFGKDVVIDLVCYRRHGHNEGDEPYFTQPEMYDRIKQRPPVFQLYSDQLIEEGVISAGEAEVFVVETRQCLEDQFEAEQEAPRKLPKPRFYEKWQAFSEPYRHQPVKTGVPKKTLQELGRRLNRLPEDFSPHSKLERILKSRLEAIEKGEGIDWANAEALAWGSIVAEGTPIRLSGQDSARGTFSQRHATVVDAASGQALTPLSELGDFQVFNSSLSEMAVVGFEYGYAMVRPEALVMWEAQFGDFVNNAQSMIDLYIASGEAKWQRANGLVMLLPHGMEGMGPEHSSARPERFLQLCAGDNLQVCQPTTPAQYFHLLRRQANSRFRKPLIVLTPKSLLRHPQATSSLADLSGAVFQPVLVQGPAAKKCRRVLMTSGKCYYELEQRRRQLEIDDVVIARIEQAYPLPEEALENLLDPYTAVKEWYWVQEEPKNMGWFDFLRPRLGSLAGRHIRYIGREPSSSPATGFRNIYDKQQESLLNNAFAT